MIQGQKLTKQIAVSYKEYDMVEEKEEPSRQAPEETGKRRDVDLNLLFPGKGYDLNRLFPDEGTKRLLHELKRNKRDIDRFIKSLNLEEES